MESYLKSGAVNRHHYALTHKVENSETVQEADAAVWSEVGRIKEEISRGLTNPREELVILIYCHTAAAAHTVTSVDLEFALSSAVKLAATGRVVKDRRIGLMFCTMFMPIEHPLQLMLVNTIRKEIESEEPPRIVLATDFITASPSLFLAPAVTPRLEILLSHKSQNIRHRALFAIRALDKISHSHSPTDSPRPTDSYLTPHRSTIMRRLTRAAREDHVRSNEVGAVGALLMTVKEMLQTGTLLPTEVIPPVAALLEKTILGSSKSKRKSQSYPKPRLVTPLLATLQSAVSVPKGDSVNENTLSDVAKLAIRVIYAFADRPASAPVLQSFRLLGALPVRLVHTLLQPIDQTTSSPTPAESDTPNSKSKLQHPVLVLRPLILSRDPTERWTSLACLQALDASLWAGVPLEREKQNNEVDGTIPPVLDEWEVGVIMKGLGDPDKTLRQLTMRVLFGVDPQLLHAFFEQLITPPPSTSVVKQQPGDPLEVLFFLYSKDGAEFAKGVGRILSKDSKKHGVDEKLVEAVVLIVDESDQAFRCKFADTILEWLEAPGDRSLTSPIAGGSTTSTFPPSSAPISQVDPTAVLLFATTSTDVTVDPQRAVFVLLELFNGRGAGIQEVLLLAALRMVPRLRQDGDIKLTMQKVEKFSQDASLGRHIRRRCELFIRFARDLELLRNLVNETRSSSLPEFLQALLSYKPGPLTQSIPSKHTVSPAQSPAPTISHSVSSLSPGFSTVSLSNSPALRYDAYAAPQPVPRRSRPNLRSSFQQHIKDSPFIREGGDITGETLLQAADYRNKGKGKANSDESGNHLRLDVHGTPKRFAASDNLANPNADLITLSALESPFREETDFRTLNLSNSLVARSPDPPLLHNSGSTTSSPRFHTATMTSPRLPEADLPQVDADTIWSSFDAVEGDAVLGKQILRGWCERAPEDVGIMLREIGVGFITQKVTAEDTKIVKEVFAFIPSPDESPGSEVAKAVVRMRPAEDGSCLWMLRCAEWQLRVRIRKLLDGESG